MVAVIAGNGLGLGNTSLTQLGQTSGGQASIGQAAVGQYLNLATGNLVLQNADEGLIFDGLALNVLRTYNSLGQLTGNQGWLFGFSRSVGGLTGTLNGAGSTITRTADDGSTVTYAYNATLGAYVSQGQSGANDTLSWNATSSTWTWTDGASRVQETYNSSGQLQTLLDPETGAQYSFSYTGSQLTTITAGDGDQLTLHYNASGALDTLSISETPPGGTAAVLRQQVGYIYDGQGRLQTVTTTLGSDTDSSTASYSTTYTYDGTSDRVASVTQSDGTTVSYTYAQDSGGTWRVATITTGTGAAAQALTLGYNLATDTTTVADAVGHVWTYTYNPAGQLTQVRAPTVNGSSPATQYSYDANGNLTQVIDANGGATTYTYDANGNRLSAEDPTGHTITYTYNADNQVTSQTTYSVPAQGVVGQSGYVAPSGAQTTYYVYDASDRLNYMIDALGNVTEHDYGTSSGVTVLSSTKQYMGVSYGLAGLSPGTPPTLAQLQSWVASSPVQATLGQMQRTDYSYDVRGQLSQSIQWGALSSSGVGSLGTDTSAIVTNFTYDAQGRLLQQATVRGSSRGTAETTTYAYDGLGRLISSTDPLNNVTSYVYTDSGNQLAITQANGLTTTQVRNSAGELVSSTQSASGQTSRVTSTLYNAVGQPVATIDPAGNITYAFYDADGRVAGTVDATGAVSAYTYDADGHVVTSTQYATLISTSGWVSAGALTASYPASLPVPVGNASDRTTHTLYDAEGRVIATIDATGDITTTTYDGDGNAVWTTAFATALSSGQLAALGASPSWSALQADLSSSSNDRVTTRIYDADNQLVGQIDPSNALTLYTYDSAGHVISTTAYATPLQAGDRSTLDTLGVPPTLGDLQGLYRTSANDQTTRDFYDDAGRLAATIDADGYVTTVAYDETTHTDLTSRYGKPLSALDLSNLTSTSASLATFQARIAQLVALGTTGATYQRSTTYDADGRVHQSVDIDGTTTGYSYNSVGQLLSTTVTPASGQSVTRTTSATYDAFGEVTSSTDGNSKITSYAHNLLGQRVTATDPLGNVTYTYYDADGRVAYTVQGQPSSGGTLNALGDVVAYSYNAFGQVASTRRYAGMLTLTTSGSSSGTTLNISSATTTQITAAAAALANAATDSTTSYTYTLDGQVAGTVDGLGYQTANVYDAFGDLVQQQQQLSGAGGSLSAANSTTATYAYDARGERTGETDGVGTAVARSTSAAYDAFGRITRTTDGRGNTITYTYDNLGRQVSTSQIVQGATRTTQTTYDALNRIVTQTDALGNTTIYQYDPDLANHKTTVTTADGVTVTTVRDAYGDVLTVTDGLNDVTTYTYDSDGNLTQTEDALGNLSKNLYDADDHLIQTTDATGHIVTYTYDASGHTLARTVDPGGLNLKTSYSYDGEGRQLSVTDPTGSVTTYSYDADGNVLTQVQDAGTGKLALETTYTYDGAGKALIVTVGAGTSAARTTQYVYDNLERLSQTIVDPSGLHLATTYAYDGNDNLTSVTDANGHVTLTAYNEANEAVLSVDAAGAVVQKTYDADGRVTSVQAYATALTGSQLSALGSAPTIAQVQADLTATAADQISYSVYNDEGQVRYSVDPMGYVTETRYDAANRVSEVLTYKAAVSITAGEATVLQQSQSTALSSVGSLVSGAGNTDASAQATLHLYDADGHQRFTVQQNTVNGQLVGVVSEQRYDATGRVVATIDYGTTLALSTSQSLAAQLSTSSVAQVLAAAPNHTTYSVYDNAGRLRYTIDATNHVTETQYDTDGRVLKTIAYANAITVPGTQSVATLASAVSAANSGTTGARIFSTTYDAAGRVTATGDAISTNATFTYDATGLEISRADRDGNLTNVQYDKAGRKTQEQSPQVTVGSYDGSGNFQSTTGYLYTTYSYDSVGNVTAISQGTGPSSGPTTVLNTTRYGYDAVNHQTSTTYNGIASTHVIYNALGQAVVDQDADGHYQYKVYDRDGRVAYSIDADGYVTGNFYDAYGNIANTTRYATALNTSDITGWTTGQALSGLQAVQGLVTSSSDRAIITTYNQLNQKTQVQQPPVAYDLATGPLGGTAMSAASPTTAYTYDAYGNVTSTAVLMQGANATGDGNATPAIWSTTYTYYDALNRATMTVTPTGSYASPQGYVTTTSYDAFGDTLTVTQYATAVSTSSVSTSAPPSLPPAGTIATGYDRATTYGYDSIGRKTSETDTGEYSYVNGNAGFATGSSVTQYGYDGENRLTSVTVNGMTTTTVYDAVGRVTSVTAPARQVLVSNWQSVLQGSLGTDLTSGNLYTTVSPVTSYVYDALGHVLSTNVASGGLSEQTWSHYDALGREVKTIDANNVEHDTTYDNNGNVLTQSYTLTSNGAASLVTTSYTYDGNNQQLCTATQRSGQSGYDAYAQVKYNAFGEVVARGDNNGYEATYTYDNAGHQLTAPDAKTGAIHSYGYDLMGDVVVDATTVTGGGGTTWTQNLIDLSGRVVWSRSPSTQGATGVNGATQELSTYDRWGNVISSTDAAGNVTQYRYDAQNHVIQVIEPNVLVVSASGVRAWQTPTKEWYYNVSGQLMGVTDENGNSSWNTYDSAGNLTVSQDGVGNKTYTAYDALGRAVAQQTPPITTTSGATYAHITYTNYDNLDRVVQQGDFELNSTGTGRAQQAQETYILDSNGDRLQVTDANLNTSYYSYDSQHRVLTSQTAIQYQSGWQESYTYDANGNKIGYTDANGNSESWAYDYFGRVQSHVDLSGATTTYTYDPSSGLLTKETSNWAPTGQGNPGYIPGLLTGSGSEIDYTYYADGQVQEEVQKAGGAAALWDTYQYDADGNQINDTTYTTDGGGAAVHNETVTSYDSHNRIATVTTINPDNSVASTRTVYNYDAAGNRRAVFVQSDYGGAAAIGGSGAAPTTGGLGTLTATAGSAWSDNISGSFTDNVGFGLTFSATGLPSWLSFNSNGVFSGSPGAPGSWTVAVTATDVNGQSVTTNVVITVPVAAPVFSSGAANQLGGVGGALNFAVSGATDLNGGTVSYSSTLSSGGSLPSWLSFNSSTLTFSGTPIAGSVGVYTITVKATSTEGGVATETFTLTVQATPPVMNGTLSNQTMYGTHQSSFGFSTSVFYESDGDTLTYSAGTYQMQSIPGEPTTENDSPLPSWLTFLPNSLTFTGTPPQSAVGQTFNIYIQGVNPQGQNVKGYFSITVAQYVQPPPVYNGGLTNQSGVIGGASVNIPMPSNAFNEPDGGALTYSGMVLIPAHTLTINKGGEPIDTNVAAIWVPISVVGLSVNSATGAITGVPESLTYETSSFSTLVYQSVSSYQIEIVATNAQGGTAAGSFTMNNTFAPIVVANPMPAQNFNPTSYFQYVMPSNVFYDPAGNTLTYSVSNLPSWMQYSGGFFDSGAGPFPVGTYNITVTAHDPISGSSASTTLTVNVLNAPPAFTGNPVNISATQYQPFSYQPPGATDVNGDAISYSAGYLSGSTWVGLPSWISFNASTYTFSGTPPTAGSYTFAVWASDTHGGVVGESFTVNVASVPQPPQYVGTLNGSDHEYVSTQNVNISAANQFMDPQGETLSYSYTGPSWLVFNNMTFLGNPKLTNDSYHTYTVTLTATDTSQLSTTISFVIGYQGPAGGKNNNALAMTAQTQTAQAQTVQAGAPDVQAFWFTYDGDNRTVVNNGALSNGQIVVTGGTYEDPSFANQYDAAGNVVIRNTVVGTTYSSSGTINPITYSAGDSMSQKMVYDGRNELMQSYYAVDTTIGQSNLGVQTAYWYDGDGHQTGSNNYLASNQVDAVYGLPDRPTGYMYVPIGGWLANGTATQFNADGDVTEQVNFNAPSRNWTQIGQRYFDGDGTLPDGGQTAVPTIGSDGIGSDGPDVVASTTNYTAFDHEDNVINYNYNQPAVLGGSPAYGASYTVSYIKKDGYLEQSTSGTPTVSGYVPATDTSYYDDFGNRIAVSQTSQNGAGTAQNVTRVFAYNTTGEIIERRTGTSSGSTFTPNGGNGTDHYVYANGQQIGDMDEAGDINVSGTLTGFSSGNPTQYVVASGDTLESIAQNVYGNSGLAYIIAAANGFTGDDDLVVGQNITVPSVTTHANTATTFKPYNAGQIIGSTTPSLPAAPPPPPSQQCNALADIVVIAVAVVVSVVTYGAASGAMAGWAAGALAGAAASTAGQLAGDALGVSHGFSFGQVFVGAVGGAIGGELASEFGSGSAGTEAASTAGNHIQELDNAIMGASTYGGTYAAEKITGQAAHFSWAGLIASAAGSVAGGEFGPTNTESAAGITSDNLEAGIEANAVQDVTTREVSVALGDSHVQSWKQVAEDVFGNALGNAAIAEMNSPSSTSGWSPDNPLSKYNALGAAGSTYGAGETLAMQQAVNSGYSFASLSGVGVYRDAAAADQGGDQLISMPGYLSSLDTNADGTPHLTDGHETVNLTPMQVSASPEDLSSAGLPGGFTPTTASWLQPSWAQQGQGPSASMQSLQVARMDTVPNSNRDNDLLRGIVQIGTTSSNPDDQVAAMAAQHELDQRDIAAYGGKLPTMADHTAFNTEQAILRANSDMAAASPFAAIGQTYAYARGHGDPQSVYVAGAAIDVAGNAIVAAGAIAGTVQIRGGSAGIPNSAIDATTSTTNAEASSGNYGVAFFGKSNLSYYTVDNATLGSNGKSFFFMPAEDSAAVTSASDAARLTGHAPSALDAHLNQGDIYGISFPTDGMQVRLPTATDAGGWPHFLEGGNTAVSLPDGGGYLVNPTREFVTPGGNAVPNGSVLFRLGPNGEWIPMRHF